MRHAIWLQAAGALTLALAGTAGAIAAESFPSKPVRFVVPFTPGSATDTLARILSPKLTEIWNQQVIVDNRGGAGGTIGANIAAKSTPDGYTLLLNSAAQAINATLYPTLPYDTAKDFAGVTMVASVPNVLVVGQQVSAKTLKELIALAKSQPGALNYGSAGVGSASHLNGELFTSMAGIKIVHVPFKGFAEQLTEIYAGRIQMTWAPQLLAMSHIQAGRLRPLAVSTAKRSSSLPNVPTAAEAGLPGFVYDPWFAIFVPSATPRPVVRELNRAIVKALQMPEVREQLLRQGAETESSTPEETDKYVRSEIVKLGKVVKASGARAE
ncbi:MAG TPA: tripartite tricarboxylate transporter substrate binding protein [Burkholderiales bacterium]|nr:tripartite tricarboxylate transporter substrate binding protein [Burkholderiales bacterium]